MLLAPTFPHLCPLRSFRLAYIFLFTLAALLCAPAGIAHAQETVSYRVSVRGAGPHADILNKHLDIVRHREDDNLAASEVERRISATPKQIRELLSTVGYFSPEVRTQIESSTMPWRIEFEVALGAPTIIDSVDLLFRGPVAEGPNAAPKRVEELRGTWSLKQGQTFTQSAWGQAKNAVLRDLLVRDYPAAAIVQSQARIDPDNHTAHLSVEIDSGPPFTFGELNVRGLRRYSSVFIDRLNTIRPGDPYDQDKLSELQSKVQQTGYFRSAFATVEVDPKSPDLAPVQLDVIELQRKRLSLGGGISTDTGVRVQARWLDRNVLQRDWRLESELLLDRETRLAASELYLRPLANGWQPSVNARMERTLNAGETNDRVRTGARITSPDFENEKVWSISLLADRQRIDPDFSVRREALLASFMYTRRRLDNPVSPRSGYVASVEIGVGPRGLVNEDNIARLLLRGNALFPLSERFRLQTRAQVAQVFGGSRLTVPGDLLFRTGGDQTVRGYAYETLGVPQNDAIVGGRVMAIASAELVYQFTPQWGAAVFVDVGNAAEEWGSFKAVQGSGVGARWASPIGQVNLDLAYGHATGKPRVHFSIGYGF